MKKMPIAEIIAEVDAYLLRLCQAREVLLNRMTETPQIRVPSRKKDAKTKAAPSSLSGRSTRENKSRSNDSAAHLNKEMARLDVSVEIPKAVDALSPKLTAITEPEREIRPNVVVTMVPARRRNSAIRAAQHRTAKPESGSERDTFKPAITLAGPAKGKIVVVPAEQVKREREQATHSEPRRPRAVVSGTTGKRAFEALFSD